MKKSMLFGKINFVDTEDVTDDAPDLNEEVDEGAPDDDDDLDVEDDEE